MGFAQGGGLGVFIFVFVMTAGKAELSGMDIETLGAADQQQRGFGLAWN